MIIINPELWNKLVASTKILVHPDFKDLKITARKKEKKTIKTKHQGHKKDSDVE